MVLQAKDYERRRRCNSVLEIGIAFQIEISPPTLPEISLEAENLIGTCTREWGSCTLYLDTVGGASVPTNK